MSGVSGADHLHVTEAGEGRPVVLLHGLTATSRYVVMGSRTLERTEHRVVAYDARGHGVSDPAEPYTYATLTEDLGAVLDARGIERAVLVGASMGAHTLLRLALEAPERVAGAVVVTPAHHALSPPSEGRWDALAAGLRADGIDGFVAAYGVEDVPERWRGTIETVLRQRMGQHEDLDAVAAAIEQVPHSTPYDVEDLDALGAAGLPSVVVADRDEADPGHPLWVGEEYARRLGAELVVEPEGKSPVAWQGGQLSRVVAALAERAAW